MKSNDYKIKWIVTEYDLIKFTNVIHFAYLDKIQFLDTNHKVIESTNGHMYREEGEAQAYILNRLYELKQKHPCVYIKLIKN